MSSQSAPALYKLLTHCCLISAHQCCLSVPISTAYQC
ncbi:unnamed protein product, partial [Staurois parvus]